MLRVAVDLGGRARVVCSVARTAVEQSCGLQGHPGLRDGEGMFFPFQPARAATFHMGKVAFPIDVVFADGAGRVARIVLAARPGTSDRWSHPVCSAVVEVAGGSARRTGLAIGDEIRVLGRRFGQQTYNLLRTLTEAGVDVDATAPALIDGYYSKEPLHTPPGGHRDMIHPVEDRFNDNTLPDQGPDAMDQPNPYFESNWGYQRPSDDDGDIAPLRMSAQEVEVDEATLATTILEAAARTGVPWKGEPLNDRIERAVVTPRVIGQWLHGLGLDEATRNTAHDVVTTRQGLDIVGDGFVAAGMADLAQVTALGSENILVLTRGRR